MKLLVVLSRVPFPLDKGDKLRAYHQIKELSKEHEIYLVALNDKAMSPEAMQELQPFCKRISVFPIRSYSLIFNLFMALVKGLPFQLGYFFRYSIRKEIRALINEVQPDHIYGQLVRVAEYIKDTNIPKTLDFQDALSMGMKRRADKSKFIKKFVFQSEYQRLKRYELKVLNTFDHCTIISHPDRLLLQNQSEIPIHVITNGVDFDFFKPMAKDKIYDLVFTGNMSYPPNVKSARYLVKEILPLVLKEIPDVKLMIAGASPHDQVKALAGEHVFVSGWMDDIRDAYAQSQVFIAPMQIGTGLQNKLLEAMAMKVPSITSELANNALNAKEYEEVLVGSTPQEYADHVLKLLSDDIYSKKMSEQAYTFVKANFSWSNSSNQLSKLFKTSK